MEKEDYRNICERHINYIRQLTLHPIPCIPQNNESVFVEFRFLPHIEFIIRNAIHKLGKGWSHTIVCGELNFFLISDICKQIPNIRIIKLDYNNISQNDYSELLCTKKFWNYFYGKKILIYQEDSCIFKTNISDFLHVDYIGAPYGNIKNTIYVGNGGLSLRNRKCMLEVIEKQPLQTFDIPEFTKDYCKEMGLTYCPEDVYFSMNIQTLNIGTVASWELANDFSTESISNELAWGGHQFWKGNSNWKNMIFKHVIKQVNIPDIMTHSHRGGWNDVLTSLKNTQILDVSSFTFLDIVEKYFIWEKENEFKTEWGGIVHYTPITPDYIDCNVDSLFLNPLFLKSLDNCKFIICLCDYLKNHMVEKLKDYPIKIYSLKHPVNDSGIKFNIDDYINNKNKHIIQVGQQLRRLSSIYKINAPHHKKMWLTGNNDIKQIMNLLYLDAIHNTVILNKRVKIKYVNNSEYDELLSKNIVFLDLYDSAANNTVLECIVRRTPMILNKTAGAIEYLGELYPLFYDSLDQVPMLLTLDMIKKTVEYLSVLKTVNVNKFTQQLCEIINDII